ncbi:mechanosensitive ion channel domain-containing protein [Pollutimonas sp. M17]|uniref:mechanosensitive ion channel domain-containing protein n=1 Tax=Pollutimonas sp. M17 TaxID=2962065 RepID=UPI0021F3E822|nr:mechanosensitive ion channel domain-containing protein [Pollutimonas sp. M17]UYO94175.1 mechanosensitive ion channel [Pollutimonas sp. M17]
MLAAAVFTTRAVAQTGPATAPADNTPSYAALADLLENDKARDKLIEQLRSLAPEGAQAPAAGVAQPTRAEPSRDPAGLPLSQRLAIDLQTFTAGLLHDTAATMTAVRAALSGEPVPGNRLRASLPALSVLLFTIVGTLLAYAAFRVLAGFGFARLNAWILDDSKGKVGPQPDPGPAAKRYRYASLTLSRKLLGVLAAFLIDVAASLSAALAGYVLSTILADGTGGKTLFALQFLTAFVMIEIAKAVSRGVFATRYDQLRLLPLSPEAAAYWNHWLTLLIGLTGYGLMVAVPVAEAVFLPAAAKVLGLIIMLGVYIYGVRVVWKNRHAVRAGLVRRAEQSSTAVFGTLLRVLGRIWHLIALAYFTMLLAVSQADQDQALVFMTRATIQTVAAVVIGLALAATLSSLLSRRIQLPDDWRRALPLLESRINAYVPATLKALRLLILITVSLVVLDAWRAFDLLAWLESANGRATVALVFRVGIILAMAALSWTVLASLIEHRLSLSGGIHRPSEREKTLLMLFRNAAAVVIATMTALIVLSQIGIDIGPLIAGAGVAGLAIGFGAQKLVQDVITGVFIQLENGMNQNDVVELAGIFGTVEKITIRSVVIRTLDGGYHLIPFSTIDKLTNHTRDFGYHYGEYNIAHRENVDEAIAQLELAFKDLMQDPELSREVLEDISIPGVTGLTERGFTIRVLIKTTPGNQWAIQRGFNRLVKQRFDAAGIELPYPQTVLHFGRDKLGYAAPVDVRGVDALKHSAGTTPAPGQTMRPALDEGN